MRIGEMRSLLQFYGETVTTGPLQSQVTAWVAGARAWGGFLPSFMTLRTYGAGEVPAGVEVAAGPEAGTRWRVVDVDRGDPDVWRLRVEPYEGSFT